MAQVVALAMRGGPLFVTALRRVWDDGDAAAPIDPRLPATARDDALATLRPSVIVDEDGERRMVESGRPTASGDAVIVATSGTSGAPKGVVLTHDAIAASAHATSSRLGVDADVDRWLACLPLTHIGGLSVVMRALVTGTALEVHGGFDAAAVQASATEHTLVSLVSTALRRVDPRRFRTVLLGGALPPDPVGDNVVTTYGMTETGSGIVYDGRPLDGVTVRLGGDGTVAVRGPSLLRAYRDGEDPKDADGWLTTGDVGHWDDDRLVIDGRHDDLIITGGENVWPEPVEALLRERADVEDVGIVGAPDDEWGHRVVAVVVPTDPGDPPTLDDLRSTVSEHLGVWHAPKELVFRGALPRTPSGKLRRSRIRG